MPKHNKTKHSSSQNASEQKPPVDPLVLVSSQEESSSTNPLPEEGKLLKADRDLSPAAHGISQLADNDQDSFPSLAADSSIIPATPSLFVDCEALEPQAMVTASNVMLDAEKGISTAKQDTQLFRRAYEALKNKHMLNDSNVEKIKSNADLQLQVCTLYENDMLYECTFSFIERVNPNNNLSTSNGYRM
jgi:hypothetical protein